MNIRIVTDSTCDLPQEIIKRYRITVIPLYIHFGDQGYLDGEEISREEFYRRLPEAEQTPTTATPGIDTILEVYRGLQQQGADQIISIHIAQALSATVDVVRTAARDAPLPVEVIDSGQLSMGVGFLVMHAARAAEAGRSASQIVQELEELGERAHVFAALDTLDYLRRSGRMNSLVAGIGSLLHVKPILKMHRGDPTSELVRTRQRAVEKLLEKLKELKPIQEIALVHSNALEEAEELWEQAKQYLPDWEEPPFAVTVTPVLGAHIGPGAIGFALIRSKER
jgi:DegV family protein with EDD domain